MSQYIWNGKGLTAVKPNPHACPPLEGRDRFSDRRDCTVVGLTLAADIPYAEAHKILFNAGRRHRHGFRVFNWLLDHRTTYGLDKQVGSYRAVRVPIKESITLAKFLRDFPRGRFLLKQRGHAFVVIDGKPLNLFTGVRTRIKDIYYFEKVAA